MYVLLAKETSSVKNIFACLFSIHNAVSLSRHEQVCLSAHLNILVHDVIDLLYYKISSAYNFILVTGKYQLIDMSYGGMIQ